MDESILAIINTALKEYSERSTEDICREIQEITKTYKYDSEKLNWFCEKVGISVHTYYMLNKQNKETCPYRPSFEVYVRVMNVGKNLDPKNGTATKPKVKKNPCSSKEYQHHYYETVTKPKRQAKRKDV